MTTAEPKYKFFCEICNYGTELKSSMNTHLKTTLHLTGHRKSKKVLENYKCNECQYENEHKYNYLSHMLNTHGTKEERKEKYKYYCDVCDIGSFAKTVYDKHCNSDKHKKNIK